MSDYDKKKRAIEETARKISKSSPEQQRAIGIKPGDRQAARDYVAERARRIDRKEG